MPFQGIPGKPNASDEITAYSVVINWSKPDTTFENLKYEVRSQPNSKNEDSWYSCGTRYEVCSARISNLKQDTEYVFQVRVATNDKNERYPWSEISDAIKTKKSAAYLHFSNTNYCHVSCLDETHKLCKLEFVKGDRDTTAKIRRLSFGGEDTSYTHEKTILFLGESGAGKSTLTNVIMNHIMAVHWTDKVRFSITDLEKDEQNRPSYKTQTQWITIYSVAPLEGGRLNYRLNIIDTPGFADTKLSKLNIDTQIRTLFDVNNNVSLHAVCIVTKGSNNRLDSNLLKLFNRILSIFGRDIIKNIVVMITHTNTHNSPVLAVLRKAGVPFEKHFSFNNEPFVERTPIAELAWGSSNDSLISFFDYIKTLTPSSLHLTRDILNKMTLAEHDIKYLTMQLQFRLQKRHQIEKEIRTLEQCKQQIEAMEISIDELKKDMSGKHVVNVKADEEIKKLEEQFEAMKVERQMYKITPCDIPEPGKALNCKICRTTCAPDAGVVKYLPIWFSGTMSFFGNCRRCVKECNSADHSVDSFEYVTKECSVVDNLGYRLTEFIIYDKQLHSVQNKAEEDKVREKLCNEKQQHSSMRNHANNIEEYIKSYEAELKTMDNNVAKCMKDLRKSFDILMKNQLKKKHHSLREYLENSFDDNDKAEFLKELEELL